MPFSTNRMNNPFQNALSQLARANAVKPFSSEFMARLHQPNREVHISIPVKMDDGTLKIFEGYRVQYNNARGPYKGGIRYHQDTEINEVKALAFWMALKCAVANIPMGGGKGGITVDPKQLTKTELESLSRGWVKLMAPLIGPEVDVPAPDVNTTPEIMGWMVDEYSKITGDKTNATFTGKPLEIGGSEGRGAATGLGGFFSFKAIQEKLGLPASCTVAIQGFGNVGSNAAESFVADGHKVIAISNSKGGVVNENGLDIKALTEYYKTNGKVMDFPGAKNITNAELLELSCDVLVPGAFENQITDQNAKNVKAKLVLELANGPTTPEADDILYSRGIPVIPDILANAGGVTVSTFEWMQNLANEHWTEAEVNEKLKKIMESETNIIYNRSKELNTDLRRTAFIVALERIEQATK
ncbi:Glu/Leu/Phe/Val dehydrogenase [Candidatus Nomurabacteria bacterium]|nr:Glu/Leu/Phe/Val dehydrogenase [Candidatus Nomurabacteria bacterium]